jgi:hypothetical protein
MSRILPFALFVLLPALAAAEPTAKVVDGRLIISGLTDTKDLRVVVAEGTEKDIAGRPAVAGSIVEAADHAIFLPRFPFQPGTRYRVTAGDWKHDFNLPKKDAGKPNAIKTIYPTAAELPENVLRFYIEFEQPMPRGDVYQYVQVLNEKRAKVDQPFLQLDDELWNEEQTRLTLLVDPGRIKKEVKPRLDLGPVFMEGGKYTLVVSGRWPTLGGGTLGNEVRRAIQVKPAINEAVDPKKWKLSPPVDDGILQVQFDRPMDHAMLLRSLSVVDSVGQTVEGKTEPARDDLGWTFHPAKPWTPGNYSLRVETALEDVCGNRVGQPFEIDVLKPAPREVKAKYMDVPFRVLK